MTCSERQDLIFLYAADQLEPAEWEELRRHLSTGCPTCAGALAEANATLAQVASSLPGVDPRPETRDSLMERIMGTNAVIPELPPLEAIRPTPQPSRMRIFATALLSAAAAIAITCGVLIPRLHQSQTQLAQTKNKPVPLQMVSMSSDTQPTARGMVAWDKDRNQWHVAVFNLQPVTDREFELWFIPQGGKPIPSKTFKVDSTGSATIVVDLPQGIGPIAMAAITDEPPGGLPAPSGKIQLAGKVPG